ncbi:c-type cytochrome [Muricoccus radiodurans]|uniref:c-type cytochrome n=1 Tax=Muricoccus radiodurans TaxID=2231721 RepID=UPI003CEF51E3
MRAPILRGLALAVLLSLPAGAADPAEALIAERNCAACHGERGISAMPNIPSLAGQRPDFITLQLILFREGLRDVPPMAQASEGLTDAQVEALAAFYAALPAGPPPDRAPRDEARAAQGAALSERLRCGICHRADFSGQNQVPRLTGQREDFLDETLRAYRDNVRRGTDTQMNAAVHGLSDADIGAIAHFIAHR